MFGGLSNVEREHKGDNVGAHRRGRVGWVWSEGEGGGGGGGGGGGINVHLFFPRLQRVRIRVSHDS